MEKENERLEPACRRVGEIACEGKKINAGDSIMKFATALKKAYARSKCPRKPQPDRRRILSDEEEILVVGLALGFSRAGRKVTKEMVIRIASSVSGSRRNKSVFSNQ